jgi:tetratricopeptide (TPR) repeat protein
MRTLMKIKPVVFIVFILLLIMPATVNAVNPYRGYIYDNLGYTPVSINGYLYANSIDGVGTEFGKLKAPEDLFVAPDDTLYIVDSGNNRVLHISQSQEVIGIYGDTEGKGLLNMPKGVFVNAQGDVYVADTMNRRIALFDKSGQFVKDFPQPESPLLGKDFVYSPSKLIADKRGYLFVVSDGANQGLMQIKPDGQFAGFFGANHVPFSWTRVLVKLVASEEQKDQIASVRPPEFSNLFQDSEGFIYTSTLGVPVNQTKRLSAVGVDTLNAYADFRYGDLYMPLSNGQELLDAFVDVSVSKSGLISALDQTTGRVFQYDKLGNLLFIFGGIGLQDGLFRTPSSIAETSDGMIYVADRTRNRIDSFYTTPFGNLVHHASELYVDGKYDEAFGPWNEVLHLNANYDLANYVIGKTFFRKQQYKEAMEYFQLARNQTGYSDALHEYRKVFVRENFGTIMTVLISTFIFIRLLLIAYRRRWYTVFRSNKNV